MQLQVLEHRDVRGKILQYLKISNNRGNDLLINVGEKTYKSVRELIAEEELAHDNKNTTCKRADACLFLYQ